MSDDELSLPKATVTKMVKDHLPPDMRMSGELTDYILRCCTEFVDLVSSEANEKAEKAKKAMIQPEHIMSALEHLGFGAYIDEVRATFDQFKADSKVANTKAKKQPTHGMSDEELAEIQRQMFAQARQRSLQLDPSNVQMQEAFSKAAASFQPGTHGPGTVMPE